MSQGTLRIWWYSVATCCVYLSLQIWSVTQQCHVKLPGLELDENHRHVAAVYGILLAAPVFAFALILLLVYARRSRVASWPLRVPLPEGTTEIARRREARVLAVGVLIVFVLVPTAAQIHFLDKMLAGTVTDIATKTTVATGWQHLTNYVPVRHALRGGKAYEYDEAPSFAFFPFWEPWFLVLIEGSLVLLLAIALFRIAAPARSRQ